MPWHTATRTTRLTGALSHCVLGQLLSVCCGSDDLKARCVTGLLQTPCPLCRDLKLDNTLLDGKKPGRVKLCDFGFAKQWEQDKRNMFTHIGYVVLPPVM